MTATATMDYRALVSKTQPRVIHSEETNEKFIRVLEDMDSRWDTLTVPEKELHELLLFLIQDFEHRNYKLQASTPRKVLAELMQSNHLKQKDLVGVFETASVVSEVLRGKRELTKDHIKRLCKRFNVSPELFL